MRAVWYLGWCEFCYGSGLDPRNVERLCPICHGYDFAPYKLEGLALLGAAEFAPLFRTRRAARQAIEDES